MRFRIGINLGDVIVEGERLYGDGGNIATRLESLATPGGICISGTAYDQVETKLALTYEDLGEQTVKNIAKPVRGLGAAYSSTGRIEEAITTLKRAVSLVPNDTIPHQILAGIYSALGREEEARAEAAEILRLNPKFSLEGLKQRLPFKDPAAVEQYLANLRKAGLK